VCGESEGEVFLVRMKCVVRVRVSSRVKSARKSLRVSEGLLESE